MLSWLSTRSSIPLALTALLSVPVAGARSIAARAFPVGTYDNEGYTLVFDASGHFRYLKDEHLFLEGEYRAKGDAVSLTDRRGVDACKGQGRETGRYRWTFDGEYLSFAKIQDACNERIQGVAGRWKQQAPRK
jgi:hypothetical protein